MTYLRLTRVTAHEWPKEARRTIGGALYDRAFEAIEFTEDAIVLPKDMRTVLQIIFRGFAWGSLEWRNKFYVHIGWDFYMYVGTDMAVAENYFDGHCSELYFERNYPSPYQAFNLPNNILHIERNKIGEEYFDKGFEINLSAEYLERLKPIWGFSDEHPFLENWLINREFKEEIEEVVGQVFNFEVYEYYISTVGWND